jgi:tetratricopeptide (TPR) repeat protein
MQTRKRTSLRIFFLATLVLAALFCFSPKMYAQIHHVGFAEVDGFRSCAESTLGRHVLLYHLEGHPSEAVPCSSITKDAFVQALKGAGYTTLIERDWALIVPSSLLFREVPSDSLTHTKGWLSMPWKGIRVDVSTTNAPNSELPFASEDLIRLQQQLLLEARFIPVTESPESLTEETADFSLHYEVYRERLSNAPQQSVVVVLHQGKSMDLGRLIFGVMDGASVTLLWDSPVLEVRTATGAPNLQFQDVDGDGIKEILVRADYPAGRTDEGAVVWTMLTIFSRTGEELSRQDCKLPDGFGAYGDAACPIVGEELRLQCAARPCVISLARDPERQYVKSGSVFKLQNGRYVRIQTSAALNEQGVELMKAMDYASAAAKFTEAFAQLSSTGSAVALYANNAGFAYYKAEKYAEAVTWLDKAIEMDPKRAVAYLNLGDAYAKLNRYPEARQAYTKYLELAPASKAAPDVKKKLDALPQLIHVGPSHLDLFLDCVQRVYGKPVLVDVSFDPQSSLEPCPHSVDDLSSALRLAGTRLFVSGDFIFLIPSKFFPPRSPDLSPYLKTLAWNKINIVSKVKPSPDISLAHCQEIGKQVLAQARLIPLEVSLLPASSQEISVGINVFILVGRVAPNGAQPIIAWINGLQTFLTGRLAYGEIRQNKYTMLWDSPLFNARGQVYFKDVDGDGQSEIIIQSQNCGNHCSDELVIFDREGRELTRQKACNTSPSAFDEEDGVCAIQGEEISLVDGAQGITSIAVKDWRVDGKNHLFELRDGHFVASQSKVTH